MGKTKLSSPWVLHYRLLEAFFREDPGVRVTLDQDKREIKLYVEGSKKAEALTALLPEEKKFGNIVVKITVIPNNLKISKIQLLKDALEGNAAVAYCDQIEGVSSNPMYFVIFEKEVVQYFTDNLGDIHGVKSTLYQDMAKEIFGDSDSEGVFFCTDTDW